MSISIEDIKNLETLSRLRLDEAGREKLAGEIRSIVDYVGLINDLDLGGVDNSQLYHAHKNITKTDDIIDCDESSKSIMMQNAIDIEGGFVKVSQVIKK